MEKHIEAGCVKTRLALLWMNISTEPLAALYSLIPFILRSELQANVFQIALFTMLYPSELKSWEFGKEAAQIFYLERATIAEWQGASEDQKFAAKLTSPKTNF